MGFSGGVLGWLRESRWGDWWRDRVKPVDSWGIIGLRMRFGYARLVDGNEIRIIIIMNE